MAGARLKTKLAEWLDIQLLAEFITFRALGMVLSLSLEFTWSGQNAVVCGLGSSVRYVWVIRLLSRKFSTQR